MAASILVTGDFVIDHHIYEGQRHHYREPVDQGVTVRTEPGGAALVADILEKLLPGLIDAPVPPIVDGTLQSPRSAYANWRPFPRQAPRDKQWWRVHEALGFGSTDDTKTGPAPIAKPPARQPVVVVFSEGGMGFRDEEAAWPKQSLARSQWIVLKTTAPIAAGPLWRYLQQKHRNQLVIVVGAHDLRKLPARISEGLSWDDTVASLLRELRPGGGLEALTQCRQLIVSFDQEGAVWIDFGARRVSAKPRAIRVAFVHDAPSIEGQRAVATEGRAFGFQSCMAAAVAWQLASDEPDMPAAIESGLAAMRDLLEHGHGRADGTPNGFPAERLAEVIKTPGQSFSRAAFDADHHVDASSWSVLGESLRHQEPAYDLARLVLLRGPIALDSVPHLQIGKYRTAERREVESLRSLVQVVRRYQRTEEQGKKPLSLAVFGPPGAGKSFAVREVSNAIIKDLGWLEFNLSQFNDADDLIGAFHQIRDQVLQKKLPVAFFDEFDAHGYKWLAPLLAPMQDGKFQDRQITHTIGKCVFVFAGGTSWTFEAFGPPGPRGTASESPEFRDFRLIKGTDFKSRLDGYLNVVGPNQRMISGEPARGRKQNSVQIGGHHFIRDREDVCFPIRRALMIRAELGCAVEEKLDLDEGLVHALLRVDAYTHGARSLGKIVQPFAAARPGPLRRSLLLPPTQLGMHVDEKSFRALCGDAPEPKRPTPLTEPQIAVMAPAIHDTWRALGRERGWPSNPETDKDFVDLDDFFKRSNSAAASRMPDNLQLVGLRLAPGLASKSAEQAVRDQLEYVLETLAEAEHDGWMDWHFAQGWHWAATKGPQQHPCLKPYVHLSQAERDKDRDAIRHYPDFARRAGMKIARVSKT